MVESRPADERPHIASMLMRESLQDRDVLLGTESDRDLRIFPSVTLVSIGGSIFDRGKKAIIPIADEIAACKIWHRMMIGVSGGIRTRHTMKIALDLGIPLGGIAQLVGAMEEINAIVLNALLAQHGSMPMQRDHFWDLPLYLNSSILPIVISVPPYHYWEPPPPEGPIPAHGSDFGLFQLAEVLSMNLIYVKDQDGLYDSDPATNPDATMYEHVTLNEILTNPPATNILDLEVFRSWETSKNIRSIQIVNGLKTGMLTAALEGDKVGTTVVKDG